MASEASALEATAKAWRAEEPRVSKGLKDDRRVLLSGAIKAMIFEVWDITRLTETRNRVGYPTPSRMTTQSPALLASSSDQGRLASSPL